MTTKNQKPFDYQAEALVTLSPSWHGDKVPLEVFNETLRATILMLKNLDSIKKTLFYGRELADHLKLEGETCHKLPVWFENDKTGEYFIHSVIGVATEAGELLELLQSVLNGEKELDKVNAKEETGDVFWYLAALAETCGFTFNEAQRTNIAKLRARYPNKFTAYDAIHRNLETERNILEG